jgi:transcriptional regulator with XRE-family HTH domain
MTLQEYIQKYGLKQKDAAAKFNMSEASVSRLLSKKRNPGFAMKQYIKQKTKGAVALEDWE